MVPRGTPLGDPWVIWSDKRPLPTRAARGCKRQLGSFLSTKEITKDHETTASLELVLYGDSQRTQLHWIVSHLTEFESCPVGRRSGEGLVHSPLLRPDASDLPSFAPAKLTRCSEATTPSEQPRFMNPVGATSSKAVHSGRLRRTILKLRFENGPLGVEKGPSQRRYRGRLDRTDLFPQCRMSLCPRLDRTWLCRFGRRSSIRLSQEASRPTGLSSP